MIRRICYLILALSFCGGIINTPVLAQTDPVTATMTATASTADQPVTQLKTLFRNQLEQYQTSEREYSLYKQQYKQLQTLASLEKAVQAARTAMVRRAEVLTTYFDLLFVQLDLASGIAPDQKQSLGQAVTELVNQLRQQKTQAEAIVDKQGVASYADSFAGLVPSILQTSYKTRAYIQVGAYQDLWQRAGGFSQEIKTIQATDSASAFKQTARQRAYQETDGQSQLVSQDLTATIEKLAVGENYNESWYSNLQEKLNSLQSGLEKLYAFVFELTNY